MGDEHARMAAWMDSNALDLIGRAMVMFSLMTELGFSSLVMVRYQALSALGWVALLGVGFCPITFLCFLRTLLILSKEKHGSA